MTGEEVEELAKLPPIDVIKSQLVGVIVAPLTQLLGLLEAPVRDLVGLIDARMRSWVRARLLRQKRRVQAEAVGRGSCRGGTG